VEALATKFKEGDSFSEVNSGSSGEETFNFLEKVPSLYLVRKVDQQSLS